MKPIELLVSEQRGCKRDNYMLEQGIPVQPMSMQDVESLGVFDDKDNPVSASVQVESTDQEGNVRWLLVSFPVSVESGGHKKFWLKKAVEQPTGESLEVSESQDGIIVKTPHYSFSLSSSAEINLTTARGQVFAGSMSMELIGDARSAVGGLRPAYYQADKLEVLEKTSKRVRLLLSGRYRAYRPKSPDIDDVQRYDTELELVLFADSPVIRYKWRITNHMRFNCPYMWLERYVLSFPLAAKPVSVDGHPGTDGVPFGDWAQVETPGGKIVITSPLTSWLGKGAGIEVSDDKICQGGILPPPDGGFGGHSPDVWRKFFNGMGRTFEGSIILDADPADIESELKPIPIIVPPEHYSEVGELPENGGPVTFGPWKDVIDRTAQWLLDTQWKGTLWFGEWWREIDVPKNLGVEETHSGNSAIGPLLHFYRTGDWRYWECAKMSFYYTFDIQFCKREDYDGPYMHTRRFMLDHQEWFHPRYQRVGGIVKPSHLFGDSRARQKAYWMLRFWADNYFDTDGCPMLPDRQGRMERLSERAMAIIGESMALAYQETGEKKFFEISKSVADWVVNSFEQENWEDMAENANSTRYILQGLMPMCKLTDDPRYKDTYIRLEEWTINSHRHHFGTHYFAFHFAFAAAAYKMSGRKELLEGIREVAKWVLSCESKDAPGTYPFHQGYQVPETYWICSYDNIAITAYLPVLASALTEAGISIEE